MAIERRASTARTFRGLNASVSSDNVVCFVLVTNVGPNVWEARDIVGVIHTASVPFAFDLPARSTNLSGVVH